MVMVKAIQASFQHFFYSFLFFSFFIFIFHFFFNKNRNHNYYIFYYCSVLFQKVILLVDEIQFNDETVLNSPDRMEQKTENLKRSQENWPMIWFDEEMKWARVVNFYRIFFRWREIQRERKYRINHKLRVNSHQIIW